MPKTQEHKFKICTPKMPKTWVIYRRVLCVKGKIGSKIRFQNVSFSPSIKLLKQSAYNLIDNECIRVVGAIHAVEGLQFYASLEMILDRQQRIA